MDSRPKDVTAFLSIFEDEMVLSDRVHLCHPDREGYFYIFEKNHEPLYWEAPFLFYVTPYADRAVKYKVDSVRSLSTLLQILYNEGWGFDSEHGEELDIPKLALVPWCVCPCIRQAGSSDDARQRDHR